VYLIILSSLHRTDWNEGTSGTFVSDLCRLRTRFVHSNLKAFNLALLGPGMALIDWIYKPSIVHRVGRYSFSMTCPLILVRFGVRGDNDERMREGEHGHFVWHSLLR